jgi:hypothetical protein
MIYTEQIDIHGFLTKRWKNDEGLLHREGEPAEITYYAAGSIMSKHFFFNGKMQNPFGPSSLHYYPDGSINMEFFHLFGEYLGQGNEGFWKLWERLTDEQRRHPNILKCLAVYS